MAADNIFLFFENQTGGTWYRQKMVRIKIVEVCGETPQTTRGTRVLPGYKFFFNNGRDWRLVRRLVFNQI
jgi:hypothetical protein